MTDEESPFKPRLGRIRSGSGRSKRTVSQVLKRMARLSGVARKGSGFTGARIGRGVNALNLIRTQGGFRGGRRRVVVKARIVKIAGRSGGLAAARAHLGYIQRDGAVREDEPGRLYDRAGDDADPKTFLDRSVEDRHQFRFIVSPEDGVELGDMKSFVRDLMTQAERDLGTRLDWVAADHFNTAMPHSHIVVRGKDQAGADLVIARDYIAHGLRARASELATLELGPPTQREQRARMMSEIGAKRFTRLDRDLIRQAGGGSLDTNRIQARDGFQRRALIGRLQVLERRGLAAQRGSGRWDVSDRLEATLRRAAERGDILKTLHRSARRAGLDVGAVSLAIFDDVDARTRPVTGRVVDRGLHDEHAGRSYLAVDADDGRMVYVKLRLGHDLDDTPVGAVVDIRAGAGRRPGAQVLTRSFQALEEQVSASGPTWLDRQLLSGAVLSPASRFGAAARGALEARADQLVSRGLASREGERLVIARGLLAALRRQELSEIGAGLARKTGLRYEPAAEGLRIEGRYGGPVRGAGAKYARIDYERAFTLVPWRAELERHRGKSLSLAVEQGALQLHRRGGLGLKR